MTSLRASRDKPKKPPVKVQARVTSPPRTSGSVQPKIADAGRSQRIDVAASETNAADSKRAAKRLRQGVEQFPIQILVPEETREALRRRSEDTGASIRHIILRSLAADGIPVPGKDRKRS